MSSIANHELHTALHRANSGCANAKAAKFHDVLSDYHPLTNLAEDILRTYPNAFKVHCILNHPPHAHGQFLCSLAQAGHTLPNEKRSNPSIPSLLIENVRKHGEIVGPSSGADPFLRAV